MPPSRRRFLQGSAFAATALAIGACGALARQTEYVGVASVQEGVFACVGIDAHGRECFRTLLPGRGHETVLIPHSKSVLVLARRPGTYAVRIDLASGAIMEQVQAAEGRHFYGHGVCSTDGRWLITSENDYVHGRGVLVVRDAQSLVVLDEYSSFGIGPHDLALLSDGRTLVVANGGIVSHPDKPRLRLNPQHLDSSLALIDIGSGALIDHFRLPDPHAGIRHLGVHTRANGQDEVVIATQRLATEPSEAPLIWLLKDEGFVVMRAPQGSWQQMNNYTASVAVAGRVAAVSSPRGHQLTFWDIETAEFLHRVHLKDVAGLGVVGDEFVASNGRGEVYRFDVKTQKMRRVVRFQGLRWDNHLSVSV